MLSLVETFSDISTVTIAGQTFPGHCVVEDEEGIRYLILHGDVVAKYFWSKAWAAGVAFLVWPLSDCFIFLSQKDFIEGRQETASGFVPPSGGALFTEWPPYSALYHISGPLVPRKTRGFVHLHCHSEFSALDGYSTIPEMIGQVTAHGQGALALADHGVCAGSPLLQRLADKAGIHAVHGMEAYFRPDRRDHNQETRNAYQHLVLLAKDDAGLQRLWALSTEAWRSGHYVKPCIDWELLEQYHEGLICTTACLRGPLAVPLLADDEPATLTALGRLQGIFGDDLYLEIHTTAEPEQRKVNESLVRLGREHGVPLVAAVDSHYPCQEDQPYHKLWLAVATNTDVTGDQVLFGGTSHYHLMAESEVREALSYLPAAVVDEAVDNTVRVADRCQAKVRGSSSTPVFSKKGGVERDKERLVDLCIGNWERRIGDQPNQDEYSARFEREMKLLVDKNFCGYFMMVADYVNWAKAHGVLVGPSRGSGGGSLVAYLAGITEMDPIACNLMFERFLTEGRTSLPDFDIDFPTSKQAMMYAYITEKYGEESVVRVGTHISLKNKGVIRDLARVQKSAMDIYYPDINVVSDLIAAAESDTAGLGLSWDDLWEQYGGFLEPYRAKYPELFDQASHLVGRLKTYGKHAAGLVIDPSGPLTDRLPMRAGDDGQMVTQFAMDDLEAQGFGKFDFLFLRTLDTVQMAVDLIEAASGVRINVYDWRDEFEDPKVWDMVCAGHVLGVFQVETTVGRRQTIELQPRSLKDLADVGTLVRPGPTRSGLTATYLRRRRGLEPVSYPDPRLEKALKGSLGCLIYQEDVMAVCQHLGGYTLNEADGVRKILGKKQVEKTQEEGRKFVQRCVANNVSQELAESLWEQMAEFAKYCLTGDSRVHLASSNHHNDGTVTIAELFRRLHTPFRPITKGRPKAGQEFRGPCLCCGETNSRVWVRGFCNACYVWRQKFLDPNRGLYGLAVNADERIRPCRILDVIENGIEDVWTITLADGKSITATANHKHLAPGGKFIAVQDLCIGDALVVTAGYERHGYNPQTDRTTVGERQLVGEVNHAYGDQNYGFVDGGFTRLMQWTAQAPDHCEECGHDGSGHRLERAHLDGNRTNNDPQNLAMLCVSCHKKHDYFFNDRVRRWEKGHITATSEIINIEYVGKQQTYSVVMDDPHILIANGIATSNSFNRSHAYGYAIIGFYCSWMKYYYPLEFLCAVLSTVDKERIPEFVDEARRMGYRVLPPDINISGRGFSIDREQQAVRYGFDGVKGVGDKAVDAIMQCQPYGSWDDFMARRGSAANMGVLKVLASIGAFDSLRPNRHALEAELAWLEDKEPCLFRDDKAKGPNDLPCVFDWSTDEPQPKGKSGKLTLLDPPKRCTKRCRHYTPRTFSDEDIEPYSPETIMNRELDLLGVYLTHSPFDIFPAEVLESCVTAADLETAEPGLYYVAAMIKAVRPRADRHGNDMGFLGLATTAGSLDVVVFKDSWKMHSESFVPKTLCFVAVVKNQRGCQLADFKVV